MRSIYKDDKGTRTWQVERRGSHWFVVVERAFPSGDVLGKVGDNYGTEDEAENELNFFADEMGMRWWRRANG